MYTNLVKRSLSLVLALVLLMGNVPTPVFATESAAEETVAETVAETSAPTEAATEAPQETSAPTEAPTAPAAEATEAPTQPATVPEETSAPTEEATEPAAEETEPALIMGEVRLEVPEIELPSNEQLHTAYVEQMFYGSFNMLGSAAGDRLTGDAKVLYDALVTAIKKIACGQRVSTSIGVGTMVTDQNGQTYIPDVEATFTEATLTAKTVNSVIEALLSDLPFELYWYDKTTGGPINYLAGEKLMFVEMQLPVAGNYQGTQAYTVDTSKTGAAAAAVANAQEIVAEYATASDYEKLTGYRDELCALVEYNFAAAESGSFSENNDPWQLVYAFDGDPNTNIVCEGYAKAFMYLCDETGFAGDVTCYTVTGYMDGGGHMWNIVTLEGENYLVDVTNSDSGSIGQNGGLFLVGGAGSAENGYVFLDSQFVYDSYTLSLWGTGADSILNLAEEDYSPKTTIEIIASGTCGSNQSWSLDENGKLTISGTGGMNYYTSGRNTPWGFQYTSSIKSLVVEEGITSVSQYAFSNLGYLETVKLPSTLSSLSNYMFSNSGMESIEIPEGVKKIGHHAFSGCAYLTDVKLPEGLTQIDYSAFEECQNLAAITLPSTLTTIGDGAFYNCKSLTSLHIPASLTSIGGAAFGGCTALTDVYVTDVNAWCRIQFGNDDANPISSGAMLHILDAQGREVTDIVLDETVTFIPMFAFCNSNITSVTLPDTVTVIKSGAFRDCKNLKSISLPDSITEIWYWAFGYCTGLESLELPDGLEMIDDYAFCGCSGVKSVTIPGTVKNIGENAFSSWTGLKELVISDGVETIGRMAFSDSYLQTLVLPDSVVTLGDAALCRAADVYYGGTQEQWSQLGSEVPESDFIHYSCTNPVNHWKFVSAEVTCETDGYTCDTCACGYQRNMVITEKAPGHDMSSWVTTREPTCDADGSRSRDCGRCGHIETEVLPGGHIEIIDDAVPATCTETGLTEGKHCDRCGNVLIAQTVEKELGHDMGSWFVSDPATCTKTGTRTKACSRCDYAEHEIIPPSHQWSNDTCSACGAVRGICGDALTWILANGTLTISGTGKMKDYSYIASSYYAPWKAYAESVHTIVIEEGVTSIGDAAFYRFLQLTSVTLPETLTSIGSAAFYGCKLLSDINLPDSLTTIEMEAFWDCDALTELAIGPNVSKLEASFAGGCQNLTNLTVAAENSYYCTDEKGVIYNANKTTLVCAPIDISGAYVIPDTVTAILTDAFYQCEQLTKVKMPANIKRIEAYTFQGCKGLTDVRLPENLETIGIGAFSAAGLTSVTIPKWVTSLDLTVFNNCSNLKTVTFVGNAPSIKSDTFYNVKATAYYHYANTSWTQDKLVGYGGNLIWMAKCTDHTTIPLVGTAPTCTQEGLSDGTFCSFCREIVEEQEILPPLGHEPGPWWTYRNPTCTETGEKRRTCIRCDYFESDVIPAAHNFVDGVCTGCGAGHGICGNDVTWTYTEGLLTISGTGAMEDYVGNAVAPWYDFRDAITSVVIEDGITAIGDTAFFQCNNLTNVTIGKDVTVIGRAAFSQCSNLASIVLPDGLITIEDTVFYGCNLTSIDIPDSVTAIGDSAFSNCWKLTRVEIPASVTEIGPYAFARCGNLTGIQVHANNRAYCNDVSGVLYTKDMTMLVQAPGALAGSYVIPEGVTRILRGAFSGCQKLTSVRIPYGVKSIEWATFGFCNSLTSIEIPSSVTVIDYAAFQGCGLTNLVIPASVKTVGDYAFCMCNSLTNVVIPDSVTSIGAYAFDACDSLADIYFGGTTDAWSALNAGAPQYTRIHHFCTAPDNHWLEAEVERTCTADGYTYETCHCGYERNAMVTIPAAGHAAVTDAAVAPTCTESGLTEGSHCTVCNEILVAQEVIPATGHDFAPAEDGIACRTCGAAVTVRFAQDYILLKAGESEQLEIEATSEDLLNKVEWSIEGEEGILSVTPDGTVTAQAEGTAYVVAELTYEGFTLSARCRVDVSGTMQIDGVQLSSQKVTTELFSTNYAGFEVLLQLPQNYSLTAEGIDVEAEHKGIAIEKAIFVDASTAEMFDILVLDDRHVQIIPTDYAVNNPTLVKGTYKSAVTVTVLGQEHTSEILNLTVRKTKPKLTATAEAFNSFYSGQTRQIVIKNATPISIMATSVPAWLKLATDGSGVLTLSEDAPLKSASGKITLQVETEEWRIPATVNLTVKNTYKARGLKLSAASVTAAANSTGIALKLLCTGKKDTLAGLNVADIKAPAGYGIEKFSIADGRFLLTSDNGFVNETVKLEVTFHDTEVKQALNLKIKIANITLTPSVKTITLNKAVGDSATVTFTAKPADYKLEDLDFRLTTSKGVDKLNSGELEISENGNQLTVHTTPKTPGKESYKLYVRAGGGKETVVTINVVSVEPTVTFKASGSMDLSFPNQSATITPTFIACSNDFVTYSYTVEELKGKTVVNADVKDKFDVRRYGNTLKVTCVDEDINLSNSYRFTFKLTLEGGRTVSNTVTLKVKRTAVKLKLSAAKLTLNKLANDKGVVTVTCTTKNYNFVRPVVTVKDSANNDAANQLNVSYADNKLTVATNENTVFGATYKISLQADRFAPASVLTVSIPQKTASTITVTAKVSGKIDIIRDGSAVTVTPTYKNRATAVPTEELFIYNAAGEDVSHLFTVTPNGKGGLTVTKAERTELPTGTYKVKLVADFGGTKAETQKLVNLSVTMGSAKLTVKTENTNLFANDKQDRALVWFTAADKTLNGVKKIEIKDAKYQEIFEVYDYGNGQFGIGFAGDVPKNLAGKTVTLNLNVYLTGNETAKPNTTAKVKLTIVK